MERAVSQDKSRAKDGSVNMPNREREVQLAFRVTEAERRLIEDKMKLFGTENMSAYLRKMAIDGYIVKLDFLQINEMMSLLRRTNASLNQIAKRLNSMGRAYVEDISEIRQRQDEIYDMVKKMLRKIVAIK